MGSLIDMAEGSTAAGNAPDDWSRDHPPVQVYAETRAGSNQFALATRWDWERIERAIDGQPTKASLIVRNLDAAKLRGSASIGTQHFIHLLDELHPDRRVRIGIGQGADDPLLLFSGWPLTRTPSWSDRHQAITVSAISEGDELARTHPAAQISGRLMRRYPFADFGELSASDLMDIDALPAAFNAEGKPNRLAERLGLDGQEVFVFTDDDDPRAQYWNTADALRYIAWHYARHCGVNSDDLMADTKTFVGAGPAEASGDPFVRRMRRRMRHTSIASMNAADALTAICREADLHYEIALTREAGISGASYFLRVFAALATDAEEQATPTRRMVAPTSWDIPRDRPFSNYQNASPGDVAQRNAAASAQLAGDDRIINAPVFLGGAREYEVTLLLRPGWLPHPMLDNMASLAQAQAAQTFWEEEFALDDTDVDEETGLPLSVYHTGHPDHHLHADVGRLWIFPDDLSYMEFDPFTGRSLVNLSPYRRDLGPWGAPVPGDGASGPPSHFYSPYVYSPDEINKLIYEHSQLGGGVDPAQTAQWVLRRRPFGDLIGRANMRQTERAPLVEFNYVATDALTALEDENWKPFTGTVLIDRQRARLWIKEDNLINSPKTRSDPLDGTSSLIHAYLGLPFVDDSGGPPAPFGPHFFVRVTCTVRGDRRLRYRPTPRTDMLARARAAIVDTGFDQFVLRNRRGQNSRLNGLPADADIAYETRTDESALTRFGDEAALVMNEPRVAGSWEAPWIKSDVLLGDSFRGVEGLGIRFARRPTCVMVEWTKDPGAAYRTVHHLTDLRHAPDVGSE